MPLSNKPLGVRGRNRATLLEMLRRNQDLSRAELSRRSGLSEGAISRIVGEMVSEGLIIESGEENSTGGRPSVRLRIDAGTLRAAGADIHAWQTRMAMGTLDGRILASTHFRTPGNPEETIELIATQYREWRRNTALEGLGISVRGIVDSEAGVLRIGSEQAWHGAQVRRWLSDRIQQPVYVENNVRAAALAEYGRAGSEQPPAACMLFVRIDEGIGMSLILDGEVYRGRRMAAGEIGQMVVADVPGKGRQDRPGCLEQTVSNPAIVAAYQRRKAAGSRALQGETEVRVRRICHRANQGETAAVVVLAEASRALGIALANLVWTLDPDVIIIDGAITEAWPLLLAGIREQFPEGREFLSFRQLQLRPSSLGADASLLGSMGLPFTRLFQTGERTARRGN